VIILKVGRYFENDEGYICFVPYTGSILIKDVKKLTDKHVIILNENFYRYNVYSNIEHTSKKYDIDKTNDDSIDECYEVFAEIIGGDVEVIKPSSNLDT